jgi:hypothetical protein
MCPPFVPVGEPCGGDIECEYDIICCCGICYATTMCACSDGVLDCWKQDIEAPCECEDTVTPVPDADASAMDEVDVKQPECPLEKPADEAPCQGDLFCGYGPGGSPLMSSPDDCCGEKYYPHECSCDAGEWTCLHYDCFCKPLPCCALGSDDCDVMGLVCALAGSQGGGKCVPPVEYPVCWGDSGCGQGETCKEAYICPCDGNCPGGDVPGTCVPEGCCLDDQDCQAGFAWKVCAQKSPDEIGRCVPWPDKDRCWDSGDCGADEACLGATFCPCGLGCGMIDASGVCKAAGDGAGAPCGPDGGDCQEGLVCCYPCGMEGCQWKCQEPCDATEPWCVDGCPVMP